MRKFAAIAEMKCLPCEEIAEDRKLPLSGHG
jgi:hypothetical protein